MTQPAKSKQLSGRKAWLIVAIAWCGLGSGQAWAQARLSNAARLPGASMGQELKTQEADILEQKTTPEVPKQPAVSLPETQEEKATTPVEAPKEEAGTPKKDGFQIQKLEVRGDMDVLKALGLYDELRKEVEGRVLTAREIQTIASNYKKKLVEKGYYLASVWTPPTDYTRGTVIYEVDIGRYGKMNFYKKVPAKAGAPEGTEAPKVPYKGRYFSEKQLRYKLSGLKEGEPFNYEAFYRSMYGINAHPDLTMDTDLHVRRDAEAGRTRRYADMDYFVDEELPLHTVFSISRSGTEATGDWRPSITLQHMNLTRHDDVLSVILGPVSPNLKDLKSVAASYYLPYDWKNGGAFTTFGGYSDLDAQDVVEGIDIKGNGWFTGLQGSYRLVANDRHQVTAAFGGVYRYIEDQLILAGNGSEPDFATDARSVRLLPFSVALTYASGRPDALGGRNFLTSQSVGNFEGLPTTKDEIAALRVDADPTYFIERMQIGRLQPLMSPTTSQKNASKHWTLFGKLDGQIGSGPLVPAEQKSIGGGDSVRGFPERIAAGDDGVSGSLELRTPLYADVLNPARYGRRAKAASAAGQNSREAAGEARDNLQFVLFSDAGYVSIKDPLGLDSSYSLLSVGAGLRLRMTRYAQMKFDWGVPLSFPSEFEDSENDPVEKSGRYHLSAQVQF
ncbi:MAG: hypothetical protein K8T26_09350 [Lentisphaerae bacterium]|nr:hypothetical protein [Lentisphaerota bacterium]